MILADVLLRVERIAAEQGDPEAAHADEDELHRDVLHAIALGHPDAQALAAAALHTVELDFSRWYA